MVQTGHESPEAPMAKATKMEMQAIVTGDLQAGKVAPAAGTNASENVAVNPHGPTVRASPRPSRRPRVTARWNATATPTESVATALSQYQRKGSERKSRAGGC